MADMMNADEIAATVVGHIMAIYDAVGIVVLSDSQKSAIARAVMDCYEAGYRAGGERAIEVVRESFERLGKVTASADLAGEGL